MDNLQVYNAVRKPPAEALKEIQAGRLKGMSDINPMWRIKVLTEQFGMCGIGWKYVITRQWLESGPKEEQAAFVNIDLFVKVEGEWSAGIPGTGGSSFIANESRGPHMSDECFKMALTDAISVSCKALGFAADVYWNKDRTKYDQAGDDKPITPPKLVPSTEKKVNWVDFWTSTQKLGYTKEEVQTIANTTDFSKWTYKKAMELYSDLKTKKLSAVIPGKQINIMEGN